MKKTLILLPPCLFFMTLFANAGKSGYIINGKTTITHQDGEQTEQKPKREPSSFNQAQNPIFFEEDDLARCYWKADQSDLFCIKKK